MTTILALDTSTESCSVALFHNGKISLKYDVAPQKHASVLLPYCEALLSEENITPADLTAIAFGCGPGSFTGVRIAAAATQGIAIAYNIPVIPVSSLHITAQVAYEKNSYKKVFVGFDARMGEIYFGHYELNPQTKIMELIDEEIVSPIEKIAKLNLSQNKNIDKIGSGFQKTAILYPSADALISIALNTIEQNDTHKIHTADMAIPVYLRDNVV